jgi:hypothetical protein
MRQVIYALRFTGHAVAVNDSGTMLKATTTAPSSALTSTVGADGLASEMQPVAGAEATFTSDVTFSSESAFDETGTISFGEGNQLRFSTIGSGYLGGSADPSLKHGTVMWQVDGGEGQFAGATGLITSNFFVGSNLEITDHHFGVLFLR